ncbi:LemA family protein [Candidatus Dojkabacteria bacterium]|uniref:LemA family protein n=1 Tax=Candidatus Dojkabacteria bacterium TaxID=2099670 RepID=A0A847VCE9_9BACT|nr:LemA family protein [Candidatus Dojkabacteria bacterium]
MQIFLFLLLLILVGGALFIISVFNSLQRAKVVVNEATSDIETFLKQRYDMIPNLVETVKGYAKHEKELFENVSKLRSKAMGSESLEKQMEMEGEMAKGISRIFAIAESYPELKANENFVKLQTHLKELEDDIQKSRRFYNGTVRDFNTSIAIFPNNIVANILKFKAFPFFEAGEEEKQNVKVNF